MIPTALEHTLAQDVALIDWVPRYSGEIGSYVSISQFLDKTGSNVRNGN
jgi:hypothetical protein